MRDENLLIRTTSGNSASAAPLGGGGGQLKRLMGLVKTALNKTIGKGMLTWAKLCKVALDVRIALNNRPLCYLEDDIQLPALTPNSLLFLRSNQLPQLESHYSGEVDLRR